MTVAKLLSEASQWLGSRGFPYNILKMKRDYPDWVETKAREVAKKVTHPSLLLVLGSGSINKDMFSTLLCVNLYTLSSHNKLPSYVYSPDFNSYSEYGGQIIYMPHLDKVPKKQLEAVSSFVNRVTSAGNTIVAGVQSVDTLTSLYGESFIVQFQDRIKLVSLPDEEEIKLEEL